MQKATQERTKNAPHIASEEATTHLDVLDGQMLIKMPYREGERDLAVLVHEFVAAYLDHKEFITSTPIDYSIPGEDASFGVGKRGNAHP